MARARFSLRDIDRGLDRLKKLDQQLRNRKTFVKVGVIGDRKEAGQPRDGKIDTVGLAIVHEYGSPKRGIPERSWIRAGFERNKGQLLQVQKALVRGIYSGKMDPARALGIMGAMLAAGIKNYVTQGPPIPPPNAKATLDRKTGKGRQALEQRTRQVARSEGRKAPRGEATEGPIQVRTLVDTGRMVDSVSWVVYVDGKEGREG